MNRRRMSAVTAFACLWLVGCGISQDDQPRPIDAALQQEDALDDVVGPVTAGGAVVYLVAPAAAGQAPALAPTARDVAIAPNALLTALFLGPSTQDSADLLSSAIPPDARLLSTSVDDGVLTVDVSSSLETLTTDALVVAVAQIVYTAAAAPGVTAVELTVDGEPREWPIADGTLRAGALTIFDYPGFVATGQPAFPPVPQRTDPPTT